MTEKTTEITPTPSVTTSLLEKTEWHLREFGWIQHQNENEFGMCLLTALNRSIRDIYGTHDFEDNPEPEPVIQVWDAIHEVIRGNSIVSWNDDEDRDFMDITYVLSRAKDFIYAS